MAEHDHTYDTPSETPGSQQMDKPLPQYSADYEEFEIGEHKVPWFLWVFFTFIVVWASISWIKFFGY